MSDYSVLYDTMGPKARRRASIATIVVFVLLAATLTTIVVRLAEHGQLAADKWLPLLSPADPTFAVLWSFLLGGLGNTVLAAGMAIVLSLVLGTLIAVCRVTVGRRLRWLVAGTIETLRGVPVVLMIFFAARVLPEFGIDLPIIFYIVIGLTAYNSVAIAEVVRTGIQNLPTGQREAASALGLSRTQALRFILLPQAFRQVLPVLAGQIVVIVKDTSLGFIIGFEELLRRGQIAIQTLGNPIQVFLVVGIVFILINLVLTRLAGVISRGPSRRLRR